MSKTPKPAFTKDRKAALYESLLTKPELFPDRDWSRAIRMHVDNVKKLITWGAVRPAIGGKGVDRQWAAETVLRAARIEALFNAGLSLRVSHTIVALFPVSHDFHRIESPRFGIFIDGDHWKVFDGREPLAVQLHDDWHLAIDDERLVTFRRADNPAGRAILGRLSPDRSIVLSSYKPDDGSPQWRRNGVHLPRMMPWADGSLAWQKVELDEQAEWSRRDAPIISATTVNLSLACRIAIRRLLDIPVFFDPALA